MPMSWQQSFSTLTDYIAHHPEIELKPNSTSIPEEVRPGFYELFDAARDAFIEEQQADILSQTRTVSQKYSYAETKVKSLLELESIRLKKPLHWFMPEAIDGLRIGLFEILFDRLKNKIDAPTFERTAKLTVQRDATMFFQQAYEKWIALSLILSLSADELYTVTLRRISRSDVMEIETPGVSEEVPSPQPSDVISFEHLGTILFTNPEYIIHSKSLGKYVSLRTSINKPIAIASNRSSNREWLDYETVAAHAPGIIPVYMADNPEDLALITDRENFCRPDLLIESRGNPNWQKQDSLEIIKYHNDILKPKLGTVIMVREPVTEPFFSVVGDNIYVLKTGLDSAKLEPLIKLLKNQSP
jgi:hypothetical protein